MHAISSVVADVEGAIASGDPHKRMGMLRQMTDLFAVEAPRLNEAQIDAFDAVILRLSRDIETKARAALAARLAALPNAPIQVIRDLAYDRSAAVAGPVLEHSERIDEGDLVRIANTGGQEHLLAITRRQTIGEAVTDVIVTRGDAQVVRGVASNRGARFSEGGFRILTTRARDDVALTDALAARTDLPPAQMAQLVGLAQERARHALTRDFGESAAAEAALAAATGLAPPPLDLTPAEVAVAARARDGLDEALVQTWLTTGETTQALVALARLAGVPSGMAVAAHRAPTMEALLFLVRAARFGWKTLKLFLAARAGEPPATEDLRSAFQAFQDLSVATAQRVVRFTAARDKVGLPRSA
ncbi:DUF2336 domain-containing protein [Methylobacterium soli]|uniref:DUF2336 domain-containing protein n=1 Tax=Methylobacterium soli TaxID=553447 RepID=A0A6L3T9C0_9HYPH|nr:DUF2336 domain-containing protein [Methylobacterium soli]KAB1080329.1 DUF2336 domain-containing protein [Methylobacterium soli]GJE41400.1 hypothetical protein AEGHOMDF_0566 [Methylobacterium soli]